MSYVSSLVTNCKGEFSAKLEPCTLLVGPNASHKSGAIAALELGLTGRCDLGALPSTLLELAPLGEPLRAALALSDGQAIAFSIAGSTAKASKPVWNGQGIGAVLSREVADILKSDAKYLRAALLRVAAGDLDIASLAAAYIPVAFQSVWSDIASGIDSVDGLAELPKLIKSRIRDLTVTVPVEIGPSEPVDSDVIAQLLSELAMVEMKLRIKRLRARRTDLATRAGAGLVAGRVTPEQLASATSLVEAADYVASWLARSNEACPTCGAPSFAQDRARGHADRAGMRVRIDAAKKNLVSNLSIGAQSELCNIDAQLVNTGNLEIAESAEELRNQLDRLTNRITELEYRKQHNAMYAEVQERARATQKQIDVLRTIGKAVDQMIVHELEGAISRFVDLASVVLMPDRLALDLYDGGRQVCRLGIEQANEQVRSWRALSGAERARCLSAIASAWSARSDAQVRLVVVDDVWLDERSLAGLCEGLARVVGKPGGPTQAIVAAVAVKSVPKGWHVVDCGTTR